MKIKEKFGSIDFICIISLSVLSILGLFAEYYLVLDYYPLEQALVNIIPFTILFCLLISYVIYGYKKPHGDLLRYIFIFYGLSCVATSVSSVMFDIQQMPNLYVNGMMWISGLVSLSAFIAGYIGGRLDKIKKNLPLIVVGTMIQFIIAILCIVHYQPFVSFWDIVLDFNWCILWCDMIFAYILRYREHKEAGLMDKD